MTALLRTLLSLALSGSVLILLLLPWLRTRTSRRWQYYIWLAAVLRLLVPFAPEASLMNQLFAPPAAVSQIGSLPEEDSAAPVLPDGAEQAADSEAALPGTDPLPEENAGESPSAGSSPAGSPDGDAPAGTTDYAGTDTPGGLTLPDAGQLAQAARRRCWRSGWGLPWCCSYAGGLPTAALCGRCAGRPGRRTTRLCWAVCAVPPAGRGYAMRWSCSVSPDCPPPCCWGYSTPALSCPTGKPAGRNCSAPCSMS